MKHLSFYYWIISLSVMLSWLIYVAANGKISYFLEAE
jgi:hypothetical protein